MNEELFRARSHRLVTFGAFCNKIADYKGRIPQRVISNLSDYSLSLTAMKEDPKLKDIAVNRLEVLDLLLKYAKAHNEGDTKQAERYHKQAVKAHDKGDRLIEEVLKIGV